MDRIEGWTAIPMTYESMSLVEGKMKLPLLKGEHTSDIQHFKHMEKTIADDLSNWLCNIYIEIRLMSLDELVDELDESKFLVTGINSNSILSEKDYMYCSTARQFNHMCGKEGTFYKKKRVKNTK
jgi:hypothetical protein